ncbi:Uncharacterised protein [Sphingobacterium spiritivorum]|uniref:Uncharacterized protein n=1 Tax=Sphingobacterium spiritivorum TaxID=258 RepID=A0A380BMA9_SPHSI|nr:hypothetical protein [Sphingobacterium spiritivorum]SUJ03580.1 Uncharacterised protein [Sphingobacterium spiritivorum]
MKYLQIIMCFLVLILTKSVLAQATYPFGTISKRIVDDHLRTDAGADKRAEDMLARMSKKRKLGGYRLCRCRFYKMDTF